MVEFGIKNTPKFRLNQRRRGVSNTYTNAVYDNGIGIPESLIASCWECDA